MSPQPRCLNRLFEWVMAVAMLVIGIHASILPVSLQQSRMAPILDVMWLPLLCSLYIAIGIVRLASLFFAKRFGAWSARLRATGALIGGMNLLQLAWAMVLSAHETGISVSPMIWWYTALAGGEFISTYRARADAKPESR